MQLGFLILNQGKIFYVRLNKTNAPVYLYKRDSHHIIYIDEL